MSAEAATAVTGAVLVVAALIVAAATDLNARGRRRTRQARIGWVLFATGCAAFITAAWMAVQ